MTPFNKDGLLKKIGYPVHPTGKHFDGTVFTCGQMAGVYPMRIPPGVVDLGNGHPNVVIGPEEHHFLFFCDTKMYLENILADPIMKERLFNAKFLVADMADYLREMVVGPFTYIGKTKEVQNAIGN